MNRARKFKTGKASVCLLSLCIVCAIGSFSRETSAKPPASITITQGTANPSSVSIGQEVGFSAQYSASAADGEYALHVCKSKKLSADKFCQDGSWCISDAFTTDNPLACKYITRAQDTGNKSYFMFVCDKLNQCSAALPGSFIVSRNTLSLQSPEKIAFKSVPFSFSSQESVGNQLGDVTLISTNTGNSPGWSLDVTATDWNDDSDGDTMDFDGDGATTGQLKADLDALTIGSSDPITGIRLGNTASFTSSVKAINIATASKKNGNGTFTLKNIKFDQFVPGNQKEGSYKTVLTFTIS